MADRSEFGPNPFRPELGRAPPHLAGRDEDLDWWCRALAESKAGSQGRLVLMYGPRGMGKTAILDRFRDLAADEGYDVIYTDAALLNEGRQGLADRLLAEVMKPGYRKEGRATSGGAAAKVGRIGGQVERRSTEVYADPLAAHGSLSARLRAYARETPLVLLFDEVHAAEDLGTVSMVANAGQTAALGSCCVTLLAGTPGLPDTLMDAGCGFTERAKGFGVGLLEAEDAKEAISMPLTNTVWRLQGDTRLALSDDALEAVVADSQGFPYFLQLWGHALWEHGAVHDKDALTAQDTASVQPQIEAARQEFYERRGGELLNDAETLLAANTVALAFEQYATTQDETLLQRAALFFAIADTLAPAHQGHRARDLAARKAMDALVKAGFIWLPPGVPHFVSGIPSYMNYAQRAYKEAVRRQGDRLLQPAAPSS